MLLYLKPHMKKKYMKKQSMLAQELMLDTYTPHAYITQPCERKFPLVNDSIEKKVFEPHV